MSIENFNVFIARGHSLELALDHLAKRRAANRAREEHAQRHAGPDAKPYGDDFTYIGICSPVPPKDRKAWMVAPGSRPIPRNAPHPCYVPKTRTSEGKALEAEMGNKLSGHGAHPLFTRPDDKDFSERIGFGLVFGEGMSLSYARVGHLGAEVVILVPKEGDFVPPDAERIPYSRYYAMQEADNAASKPKA